MFDCAVLMLARVLRMFSCATVGVGCAATAEALSVVLRLTADPVNNACTPPAKLVVTVRLAATLTAVDWVASAVNARSPLAAVCTLPHVMVSVLLPSTM